MPDPLPPDTLNEVGVLKRREIEARILAPLIGAFAAEFGRERVLEIARRVIVFVAEDRSVDLSLGRIFQTLDLLLRLAGYVDLHRLNVFLDAVD